MSLFTSDQFIGYKEYIIPIVTALITWGLARKKNEADIHKINAETNKINLESSISLNDASAKNFLNIINAQEVRINELKDEIEVLHTQLIELKSFYERKLELIIKFITNNLNDSDINHSKQILNLLTIKQND